VTDSPDFGWHHLYRPASTPGPSILGRRTLLLLHGTGGDEHSLLPLADAAAPGQAVLSVRGRSLEEGSPRFFRRFAPATFDQDQIRSEAQALADFLQAASQQYGFDPARITALGYSNGANIGLALLLLRPASLAAAALLRPVAALWPQPSTELNGKRVLILQGRRDPYLNGGQAIAPHLGAHGAEVSTHIQDAGHELTQADVAQLGAWLDQAH
jgi:phospholipase/carboxylesterase